jgi:hypothetical protein
LRRFAALTRAQRLCTRTGVVAVRARSFGTEVPQDDDGVELQGEIKLRKSSFRNRAS